MSFGDWRLLIHHTGLKKTNFAQQISYNTTELGRETSVNHPLLKRVLADVLCLSIDSIVYNDGLIALESHVKIIVSGWGLLWSHSNVSDEYAEPYYEEN